MQERLAAKLLQQLSLSRHEWQAPAGELAYWAMSEAAAAAWLPGQPMMWLAWAPAVLLQG
jgi:hypothetical protein